MSFTGTPDAYLDEILNLPRVVAESVSPDLAWFAFSWANVGAAVDVWVTPISGTEALGDPA